MRTASQLVALLTFVAIPSPPASAIPDLRGTITTERLVGTWALLGPGGEGSTRFSATLRILSGPPSGPLYSGAVRCAGVYECPGRRADLRGITVVRRTQLGRDRLIYDFDADATFETGVTCHFAGVTVSGEVYELSSHFDCTSAGGLTAGYGDFRLLIRGRPKQRPTNQ